MILNNQNIVIERNALSPHPLKTKNLVYLILEMVHKVFENSVQLNILNIFHGVPKF